MQITFLLTLLWISDFSVHCASEHTDKEKLLAKKRDYIADYESLVKPSEFVGMYRALGKLLYKKKIRSLRIKPRNRLSRISRLPKFIYEEGKHLESIKIENFVISEFDTKIFSLPNLKNIYIYAGRIYKVNNNMEEKRNAITSMALPPYILHAISNKLHLFTSLRELEVGFLDSGNANAFDKSKELYKYDDERRKIRKNPLPDTISTLRKLEVFKMKQLKLDCIPSIIGQLTTLKKIAISNGSLVKLDFGVLRGLASLEELIFRSNGLYKLPESIGELKDCKNLRKLDLSWNTLSELPKEIGLITSLEELILDSNKFTEIPSHIGCLKNLKKLSFSKNSLSIIPKGICNLLSLKELVLNSNEFKEIPECISAFENLEKLSMRENKIQRVPDSVLELRKLKKLDLSDNRITSMPRANKPCSLVHLDLSNNKINSIARVSTKLDIKLEHPDSESNNSEYISSLAWLVNLRVFKLNNNRITRVPIGIRNLKSLRYLDVSHNKIISAIGLETCEDSKLIYIDLSYNKIRNWPSLSSHERLQVLKIEGNDMQSPLPFELLPIMERLKSMPNLERKDWIELCLEDL